MAQIKSCGDCTFYKRGYCTRKTRNVLSDGEAVFCDYYTPIGQVAISDLSLLGGQLAEWQIPNGIIDSLKIADSAVKTAKIDNSAITTAKIASGAVDSSKIADGTIITADLENWIVTNIKVANDAAIAESKLDLTYSTQALMDAILLRQLLSEKDQSNGYLGLDAGAKVPLARLNPITNSEVAAGAAIDESKLNLNWPTHSNANDHAESHGLDDAVHTGTLSWAKVSKIGSQLADLATRYHSQLTNIGTNDHHSESHTLASHSTKAHSELTNINPNDHGCISDTAYGPTWDAVHNIGASKDALYDKISQLEKLLMFGSGNRAWVPCVFVTPMDGNQLNYWRYVGLAVGDGSAVYYMLPKPTKKNDLKLYIDDAIVAVVDADGDDYIDNFQIYGADYTGATAIVSDTTNQTSIGDKLYSFSPEDVSSYDVIHVKITVKTTTDNDLEFLPPMLGCYYST